MISFENEREHNSPISEEVFYGFVRACGNLSRYGTRAQDGEPPTFYTISAENDLLQISQVSVTDNPSHVGTGGIILPDEYQEPDLIGSYWVYQPIESNSGKEVTFKDDRVKVSSVVRFQEMEIIHKKYSPNNLVITTATTTGGRIFKSLSFQSATKPIISTELTKDIAVIRDTRELEAQLAKLAIVYPDVDLSK